MLGHTALSEAPVSAQANAWATTDPAFAIVSSTTCVWSAVSSAACVGASACEFLTSDRAASFAGASTFTVAPTAEFAISGIAELSMSPTMRASFAGSASLIGVNQSTALGKFRCNAKVSVDFRGKYEAFATFRVEGKTRFAAVSNHTALMRMRGRSRTIMRWRSAPWPW